MLNYIPDDGYTEDAYIAERPRLHTAVRFTFRPVLADVTSEHLQAVRNLKADVADAKTAKVVADHLKSWDIPTRDGKLLDHTDPKMLLRLKRELFNRISQIVFGLDEPDEDPEAPAKPRNASYESATNSRDRREADAKN